MNTYHGGDHDRALREEYEKAQKLRENKAAQSTHTPSTQGKPPSCNDNTVSTTNKTPPSSDQGSTTSGGGSSNMTTAQ
jgi:hypothetical protein